MRGCITNLLKAWKKVVILEGRECGASGVIGNTLLGGRTRLLVLIITNGSHASEGRWGEDVVSVSGVLLSITPTGYQLIHTEHVHQRTNVKKYPISNVDSVVEMIKTVRDNIRFFSAQATRRISNTEMITIYYIFC